MISAVKKFQVWEELAKPFLRQSGKCELIEDFKPHVKRLETEGWQLVLLLSLKDQG